MAYYLSCCFGSFSVKDEEGLKERKKIRLAHSLRKIRPVRKVFREIGKVVIKRKMVHPEPQPASPRKVRAWDGQRGHAEGSSSAFAPACYLGRLSARRACLTRPSARWMPAPLLQGDVEGGAPTPRRTQSIEHKVLEERKQAAQKIRDDAVRWPVGLPSRRTRAARGWIT